MSTLKTATLAAVLIAGATSLTMAQNGPSGGANGNNGMPPDSYKGPGAYQGYQTKDFQAPAGATNNMPPDSYKGPGAYQNYDASQFGGNPAGNAAASGGSGTHGTSQRTGSAQNSQKVFRNQNGYRSGTYRVYSYYRGTRCHLIHRVGGDHLVRVCD